MKKYEGSQTFQHTWHQIAIAFWKRYPNKHSRHVLSEDILDRQVNHSGQLVTKRLFVKTNSCPKWIERLMKTKNVHILEESFVDPIRQTLTTITRNLGMTNLMSVEETCVYRPHPENKIWTIVERRASFDSKLTGFKKLAILACGFERYKFNIRRTDSGFKQVILNHIKATIVDKTYTQPYNHLKMVDCQASSNGPIETITLDSSSDEAPSPPQADPAQGPATSELPDANQSSDSNVSSLNYYECAAESEQRQNKSNATLNQTEKPPDKLEETTGLTNQLPNTSLGSAAPKVPSFMFGPYVPIFRRANNIIIDPRGIIKSYHDSNPPMTSRRLACQVLPDDTIVDSPSFLVPLLLKKKTILPPADDIQPREQATKDNGDNQEEQNSENPSTSQISRPDDVQFIEVVEPSNTGHNNKNVNRKSIDDYIRSTCVASLTSHKRSGITQPISTLHDYHKSSVGQLLLGIGLSRVRETCLQDSAKKLARKIRNRGGDSEQYRLYDSLKEQISQTIACNKVFKPAKVYNCPLCEFKTEFSVVMDGHLEIPHMNKRDYLCNWCDFKSRHSADIAHHSIVKHDKRCRFEKPPSTHVCHLCPFECKDKRRLKSHLAMCEQQFNFRSNSFLGPQDYGQYDYPAVTSKLINQEDIKAYENTLKLLRLAAYNPHQLEISGPQQASNQPILLVQRQNGQLPPGYVVSSGGNPPFTIPNAALNATHPTSMTKDQLASANNIANQHYQSSQLLQLLSGQNPNINQLRTGILQYPRAQSPFVNGNSVLKTTSEFVMAPNHQPRATVGGGDSFQDVDTLDLMNEKEDIQMPQNQAMNFADQSNTASSNPKNSTFVICEICDGYIKDLGQLKSHMQWIHKVKIHQKMLISRPPLNCQKCQWRFFTDQGLERHLLGAHGLVTSNMQELVEKGSDSGRCTVCGRAFASKLVAHMKEAHKSTLKPAHLTYKCTVCSAAFNLYRLFENHVYSVHSDSVRRISDDS